MQKNSVFQAASFGDLLLNEKQERPFVSLDNVVAEASTVIFFPGGQGEELILQSDCS